MTETEVYIHVVKKLIGPFRPVGESWEDSVRQENLERLTTLIDALLYEIQDCFDDNKHMHQTSVKRNVAHCKEFLESISDYIPKEEEWK